MAESKRELAPNETEFLRFVVQAICDAYGGAWSSGALITTAELSKAIMREDPGSTINLFRKQHGNLAKVLGSTQFAPYLSVDHDVIRWRDVGSLRGVIPEEVAERASALDAEIASRRAGK